MAERHDLVRHELSAEEIIRAGRAYETRATWGHAREFTWALYGRAVARVTYSQTTVREGDHRLRTTQTLAFDAAGCLLPYDFGAAWWAERDLPEYILASAWELTQDDLARGLGGGFPDEIRDALRAFAAERLGVETLHTWLGSNESETLTWMFDLTTPPPFPYTKIADDAGATLSGEDVIAEARRHEANARWTCVREYVRTLYGERAARADVIMFSRYNDFTYDRDVRLEVVDATGTRLFYDLRLPWWTQFAFSEAEIAQYIEQHDPAKEHDEREVDAAYSYDVHNRAQDQIERLATRLLGADFIATRNPWDSDTVSYDLTHPPEVRFPRLWAASEDHPVTS
jgi:hypothetical protein